MILFDTEVAESSQIAIVADAFSVRSFDFDIALLACALACDLRMTGTVEVVSVGEDTEPSFITQTAATLANLGIGFRQVRVGGGRQDEAMALRNWLDEQDYAAIVSLAPDLTVYAAEKGARRRAPLVAGLCRPLIPELRALGVFMNDTVPYENEMLVLRGLRSADFAVTLGNQSRDYAAELGLDLQSADWISPIRRFLRLAIPPPIPGPSAGRVAIIGNVDTRSGQEIVLDALKGAPGRPDIILSGHAGRSPTIHPLIDIGRFIAAYSGRVVPNPTIDIIRILRDLRAQDLLARYNAGGLDTVAVIAGVLELGYCGRSGEAAAFAGSKRVLASDARSFARALQAAVREGLQPINPRAERDQPPWLPPLVEQLAAREISPIAESAGRSPRANLVRRNIDEIVAILPPAFKVGVETLATRLRAFGPDDARVTLVVPEGCAAGQAHTVAYPAAEGPGAALHRHIASACSGDVLVMLGSSSLHATSGPLPAIMAPPDDVLLFGVEGRRPPLTAAALLLATAEPAAPLVVSAEMFRRCAPELRSLTGDGLLREIALRAILGGYGVRDLPTPNFAPPIPWTSIGPHLLAAIHDSRTLAQIAAETVPPALRDALRLYQDPQLRDAYDRSGLRGRPAARLLADEYGGAFTLLGGLTSGESLIPGVVAASDREIGRD